MLHTKSQGQWPFGSREDDILRGLPYMGIADGGHLGHVTVNICYKITPLNLKVSM